MRTLPGLTASRLCALLSVVIIASGCKLSLRNTHKAGQSPDPSSHQDPPQNDPPQNPPTGSKGFTVVQGQGQVAPARFAFPDPLQVQLKDSAGRPVAGATVTWTSSDTTGALDFTQKTSVTNAEGVAELAISAGTIGTTESSRIVIVTAQTTYKGETLGTPFYETVAMSGGSSMPRAFFLKSAAVYEVRAGTTLKEALKVSVVNSTGDQQGRPVPGVQLRVTPIYPEGEDPSRLPSVFCETLTNLQGEATCDLTAGEQSGTVQVSVSVGRFVTYDKSSVRVEP